MPVQKKEAAQQQEGSGAENVSGEEKDSTAAMEQMEIEIPNFDHVNLYKDNVDLPQIKPRTINNRNEFYIAIPRPEHPIEISKEEARRAIGNTVIEDYEKRHLAALRQQLKEKKEILAKKQAQLHERKRQTQMEH